MAKIKDYAISRSVEIADLRNEVFALIAQGWQPFGSLTSSPCYLNGQGQLPNIGELHTVPRVMYAQALVKYAED